MFKKEIGRAVSRHLEEKEDELLKKLRRSMEDTIKDEVRVACRELVTEMFAPKADTMQVSYWGDRDITPLGTFKAELKDAVLQAQGEQLAAATEEVIYGEKFIDDVVARINAKQV